MVGANKTRRLSANKRLVSNNAIETSPRSRTPWREMSSSEIYLVADIRFAVALASAAGLGWKNS